MARAGISLHRFPGSIAFSLAVKKSSENQPTLLHLRCKDSGGIILWRMLAQASVWREGENYWTDPTQSGFGFDYLCPCSLLGNNDQKHWKHRPTLLCIGCKEETYLDGCSSPCVSVRMKGRPNCGEDLHQIIGLKDIRVALALYLLFVPL